MALKVHHSKKHKSKNIKDIYPQETFKSHYLLCLIFLTV